jgi:hypothetical protein
MRLFLTSLFACVFTVMVGVTVWASMDRNVFQTGDLFADPWFVATLCDAYCGFLIFYVWVAYRESSMPRRVLWFVALMGLGNIAAALYVLLALARMDRGTSWAQFLLGRSPSPSSEAQ